MSPINGQSGGPLSHIWDREQVLAPLLIAPAILYIVVLVGAPFFLAIYYSLSDATTGSPTLNFVGLRNFQAVLKDPVFRKSLINTFIFTFFSQALVLVLAKVLALALIKDFRGKWLVRFLILLPWTAPIALGTIGWMWMLDSIFSPIDWILRYMDLLGAPDAILGTNSNLYWLGVPKLAMLSVILVHTWRMLPLATVILLAGLTAIPQEILDAAEVDGAGSWRRLFQIMIPLLLPIMTVAVLFGIVFTFTDIAVVYIGLNSRQEAFDQLEQAFNDHSNFLIFIHIDPRFDSVRGDPRYQNLLRRMNLEF